LVGHNGEGPVPVYIDVTALRNSKFQTMILPCESVVTPKAEVVVFACVMVTAPSVKLNAVGTKNPLKLGASGLPTVNEPEMLHCDGHDVPPPN
jgi:hypothetical protein